MTHLVRIKYTFLTIFSCLWMNLAIVGKIHRVVPKVSKRTHPRTQLAADSSQVAQ